MNCRDFLLRHSEYVDGAIDATAAALMSEHARLCASCARYDRVIRRGGDLVREFLPSVEVSEDFAPRMRHRLYHERDDMARRRAAPASVYAAAASFLFVVVGAGTFAVAMDRTPVVDAQVVWAEAPRPFTPIDSHAVAVARVPTVSHVGPKTVAPATSIEAEARGHDAHVASPAAWPVYSRGAVAVAFPASRPAIVVSPAEFRQSAAGYRTVGAILVRH